jgi:hypothetical protein
MVKKQVRAQDVQQGQGTIGDWRFCQPSLVQTGQKG